MKTEVLTKEHLAIINEHGLRPFYHSEDPERILHIHMDDHHCPEGHNIVESKRVYVHPDQLHEAAPICHHCHEHLHHLLSVPQ